ncbi:MAG: TIGR00266 family protein [Myxococcales bacterium]|nr:TIGR00266 family protein [Myxococcales bacterium]
MEVEILAQPAGSVARLRLRAGESVTSEVGAMISMSSGLTVETSARRRGKKGLLKGLKRMFAGENFFLNEFTAHRDGAEVVVGPSLLGDIVHHRLNGGTLIVQGSSWLASGPGVEIDASFQGLGKAFFSGEGVCWVKLSGTGDVLLNSFGAVYPVEVGGGYTVDTGHIVAFEETLGFRIGKAGDSLIGSILGGEGLVCKFQGQGTLYCQTHNPPGFGKLLGPMLKTRPG